MGQDVDVWTLDFMIQIFRQKKTKKGLTMGPTVLTILNCLSGGLEREFTRIN